jgi:hypothetical protein
MSCNTLRPAALAFVVAVSLVALSARGADRPAAAERNHGSTPSSTLTLLDSEAMNHMLRADLDKDGTLSREELERYDLGLARRFREADLDRDGKLTLYEFEKLLTPRRTPVSTK